MNSGLLLAEYSLEITIRDFERLSAARDDIGPNAAISIVFLPGDEKRKLVAAAAVRCVGVVSEAHISARRMTSNEKLARVLEDLRHVTQIDRVLCDRRRSLEAPWAL